MIVLNGLGITRISSQCDLFIHNKGVRLMKGLKKFLHKYVFN